jgi:hypothetical protein
MASRLKRKPMKLYFDSRDWWIGYFRGEDHHYVCLIPTLVFRWERREFR